MIVEIGLMFRAEGESGLMIVEIGLMFRAEYESASKLEKVLAWFNNNSTRHRHIIPSYIYITKYLFNLNSILS